MDVVTQVAAPSEVDFFSASIWKIVLGDFVSPSGSLVAKNNHEVWITCASGLNLRVYKKFKKDRKSLPGEDDEENESSSPTTCFKAFVSVEEFLAETRLINSGGKPDSAEYKQQSHEWT